MTVDVGIVHDEYGQKFTRLAVNQHAKDGLIVLYNYEGLLAMKSEDFFDNRLASQEAAKQRELEKNYFILSAGDKFRVHLNKRFKLGPSGKIQHIEIHEVDLIFVLSDRGEIFVLNHVLKNDEDGLVFRFKDPEYSAKSIDFFLL